MLVLACAGGCIFVVVTVLMRACWWMLVSVFSFCDGTCMLVLVCAFLVF